MELIDWITSLELNQIIIVVVMCLYVFTIIYVKESQKIRIKEKKKNFFNVLRDGLQNGSISTLEDVLNLYAGLPNFISGKIDYRAMVSRYLKEFLVLLVSKNKEYIDSDIDDVRIIAWKQKITDFIKKNEEISPYSELPTIEKNILDDILSFLAKNDSESVTRKISELSNAIKIRNNDFRKIQSINKISTIFAIVGTFLTIIFGILALA